MLSSALQTALTDFKQKPTGRLTVLTGAGISAESGIPTFRGPEGYWTVGSKEYRPQEMATQRMFRRQPDEVWRWYLYRRGVCNGADPNDGHKALVNLEEAYGSRFTLITQNVDGLHLRAGNSLAHTFQIHGNTDYMRCLNAACDPTPQPIPVNLPPKAKDESLTEADKLALRCPICQSPTRPHVLWFDEFYNEQFFKYDSAIAVAKETDLLVVIGTSGATNLPLIVAGEVLHRGGLLIDINPNANPFSQAAEDHGGFAVQASSGQALPAMLAYLV